jgi:hypothetical protein
VIGGEVTTRVAISVLIPKGAEVAMASQRRREQGAVNAKLNGKNKIKIKFGTM